MFFDKISYFEFSINLNGEKVYVDRFPSDKTTLEPGLKIPKGLRVFPEILADTFTRDFFLFLTSLNSIHGNFYDFLWFLPNIDVHTVENIFSWLTSLYFAVDENANVLIKSSIKSDFQVSVHLKSRSLPGQAIDAIPIFKTKDNQLFVSLGYKKKPKCVEVVFPHFVERMEGLSGFVLFGEHLEPSETKRMDELYEKFVTNGNKSIELNKHTSSPAYRALMEEGGFELEDSTAFYVGKDATPGRDDRYWWKFDGYGYERVSISHMVTIIVSGTPPASLPEPKDTEECSKGVILPVEVALAEFRVGGKYPPAFPAHVNQLKTCLSIVNV
jgi:hypothetical protein